jgi:hypothetical protein
MTSIDDLKYDVKSAQENVLRDLSPEERVRMFAKAYGESGGGLEKFDDERTDWLRESIPANSHADYRKKMLIATDLSRSATYGLHMGYMQYRLAEKKYRSALLEWLAMPEYDQDSVAADALPDREHEQIMDRAKQSLETTATGLYIEYHANKRFAEEVLDVDLEALLALSPSGWIDHVDFGAVLKRAEAEGHITDPLTVEDGDDTEEMPLEDAVEHLYDECVRNWEGDLEEGKV